MSCTMHTLASSSVRGTPTAAPSEEKGEKSHFRALFQVHIYTVRGCSVSPFVLPAGLTCLKEVAAAIPRALLSSLTSCQAFRASHRLIKPGEPLTTERGQKRGRSTNTKSMMNQDKLFGCSFERE